MGSSENTRETDVEKALVRTVERQGGKCLKFLTTTNGWPDRLILWSGPVTEFAETKKPKKHLRKLQEWRKMQLEKFEKYSIQEKH